MRYVTIPETIVLRNAIEVATGKHPTQDFVGFVQHVLGDNESVTADDQSLLLFVEAARRFEGKKVGAVVPLTDAEHELLARLARTYKYQPAVRLDMFQFVAHLIEAPREEPKSSISVLIPNPPKEESHKVRTGRRRG